MKRSIMTAVTFAAIAAFTTTAFAQSATTRCKTGEVQVLEYDFTLDDAGHDVVDRYASPRLVESRCVAGQTGKMSFRGVLAEFKTRDDIHTAILGAELFASIGLTDPAAIKQLVERVVALKAAEAARPKPKVEPKPVAAAKPNGGDFFKYITEDPPKKK